MPFLVCVSHPFERVLILFTNNVADTIELFIDRYHIQYIHILWTASSLEEGLNEYRHYISSKTIDYSFCWDSFCASGLRGFRCLSGLSLSDGFLFIDSFLGFGTFCKLNV